MKRPLLPAAPASATPRRPWATGVGQRLRNVLDRVCDTAAWLALPIAGLLFLQWPLRDALQWSPRLANDTAQWMFALYVALAMRQAGRRHAHLAADTLARRWPTPWRRALERFGLALPVLPWALFAVAIGWPQAWRSVLQFEHFGESLNPGFFIVKLAMVLLPLGLALQACADLTAGPVEAPAEAEGGPDDASRP